MPDVLQIIQQWLTCRSGRPRRITVTGFHGIWRAYRDPAIWEALNSAELWVPDGIAPVLISRLRGLRGAERVPGADLMRGFFELAEEMQLSSFFYGDTEETLARLTRALVREYPGHRIAGALSPPFRALRPDEEACHVDTINGSGADVLWVGLGMPKQDLWLHRNRQRLQVPVAAGVGAAFRFLAGDTRRAPQWMGRAGLEWLWRLVNEPRKCWRRCLLDGPQFVAHALLEMGGLLSIESEALPERKWSGEVQEHGWH
jgi:N-acetylglucosaminyldiphosphoundecaprenol N-acetyl-beta-D-mannosaminyltransferase